MIAGGVQVSWDGQNAVGLLELNTSDSGMRLTEFPYHPIEPAHVATG